MFVVGTVLIIPAIIFALVAQSRVMGAFNRFSEIPSARGTTACQLARRLLDENNCGHVQVIQTQGHLTDHYNPRTKVVALSSEVYSSTSLAALGIAAHEVGHAIQHQQRYAPLMIRQLVIKTTGLVSKVLMPLIIIGLIASFFTVGSTIMGIRSENFWFILITAFAAMYMISFLINLVTLPTEYNASSRAKRLLRDGGHLQDEEEYDGVSKVLGAAALTYVASLVTSMAFMLRFLGLLLMMQRRR